MRRGGFWRLILRRFAHHRLAIAGTALLVGFLLLAWVGPLLWPVDPFSTEGSPFSPPATRHSLGSDDLGRDVLAMEIHGARISLSVGMLSASTSLAIGVVIGSLSGFYGGWIDSVSMRLTEFFLVIPRFFLALLAIALFGPRLLTVVLVIGGLSWPSNARLVRAEFLSLKEREFVEAARAIGVSTTGLIFRHILPNAVGPVLVNTALLVSEAILLEAGFSFLGLGDPNTMSWGVMLNSAQRFLRDAWWMSVFPGLSLLGVALAFTFLSDGLNDAMNPHSFRAASKAYWAAAKRGRGAESVDDADERGAGKLEHTGVL